MATPPAGEELGRFVVEGRPGRWERTGGQGRRRYTKPQTRRYEARVAVLARQALGAGTLDVPLSVRLVCVWKRPKTLPKTLRGHGEGRLVRPSTPDADNVAKAVLDGMQRGRVISDDAIVVHLEVAKLYAAVGEEPHVEVVVCRMRPAWEVA